MKKNIIILALLAPLVGCSAIEQAKTDFANLKKTVAIHQTSKTYSNMYWTIKPYNYDNKNY